VSKHRRFALLVAVTTLTAACATGTTATTQPETTTSPSAGFDATAGETTTEAPFTRFVEIAADPPAWQDVTITTEDGVGLYGRFWPGGDTALLVGHDYSVTTVGASGERPPQSSETMLPEAGTFAAAGYTVLSPDFRGHGASGGEFAPQQGPVDLAAAYQFLIDRGYEKIVMVGWVGSGTTAVALDAADDDVAFGGIVMVFSPPQDHGIDADRVLGELETPIYFIGGQAGPTASWAKRMSAKALDSRGWYIFDHVPSGFSFLDVYGSELVGRILDFADSVA
jgi:hypothetical protein